MSARVRRYLNTSQAQKSWRNIAAEISVLQNVSTGDRRYKEECPKLYMYKHLKNFEGALQDVGVSIFPL